MKATTACDVHGDGDDRMILVNVGVQGFYCFCTPISEAHKKTRETCLALLFVVSGVAEKILI